MADLLVVVNWIINFIISLPRNILSFVSNISPVGLSVSLIFLFPVIVGVAKVVQNWLAEREGEY